MYRAQENYRIAALGGLVLVALVFAGNAAFSAGVADRGKPDPILSGSPMASSGGRCDPALDLADATPGVDVDGKPVASADLPTPPVHLDGGIAMPLRPTPGRAGNSAYVMVDGLKLDPLLNPPACR
jgi:hypothetical protein